MLLSSGKSGYQSIIRGVLDACADCDTCRFLMDESCLLFPELYRLYDAEKEHGRTIGEDELRRLSELCTLCGLCPCPDIRMDVIRGKTERVRAKGLPLAIRFKVAYFAGCTAGYLFPEVARAVVEVMARNGVSVFLPPQQCCGMPTLLEGDEPTTLRRMLSNLQILLEAMHDGFDIVCSCLTCGYLMKVLLQQGAFYSEAYQRAVDAGADEINEFYHASIRLASPLIRKIQAAAPEAIITDCLSCRLQFQHLLPLPVDHPLEILWRGYRKDATAQGVKQK